MEVSALNAQIKQIARNFGFEITINNYVATYYSKQNPIYKRVFNYGVGLLPPVSFWETYFKQEAENAKEKVVLLSEQGELKLEMMLLPKFFISGKEVTSEEAFLFYANCQIKSGKKETKEYFEEALKNYNKEVKK